MSSWKHRLTGCFCSHTNKQTHRRETLAPFCGHNDKLWHIIRRAASCKRRERCNCFGWNGRMHSDDKARSEMEALRRAGRMQGWQNLGVARLRNHCCESEKIALTDASQVASRTVGTSRALDSRLWLSICAGSALWECSKALLTGHSRPYLQIDVSQTQTLARQGGRRGRFVACSEPHDVPAPLGVQALSVDCMNVCIDGAGWCDGLLCARGGASARPPPPRSVVFYCRCRIVPCMGQAAIRATEFMQHKYSYEWYTYRVPSTINLAISLIEDLSTGKFIRVRTGVRAGMHAWLHACRSRGSCFAQNVRKSIV